jgi:PAS domain S-box-containing protein
LVLVVNDEAQVRVTLGSALESQGYSVAQAADGEQALAMYQETRPDIIVLDLVLPGLSGVQTCARLAGDHVPVLVVAAADDEESIRQAFDAGATDTITKPVRLPVLRRRVAYLLRIQQAEQALGESEERYRTLFEQSRDAIYIANRDWQLVDVSQSAVDLLGYGREEMIGAPLQKILAAPAGRQSLQERLEKTGFVRDYPIALGKNGGGEIECLVTSTVMRAGDGSILGYQGIIRDVTERKRVQARMVATHKLAGLGALAAGVAHEVNSALQVIARLSHSPKQRLKENSAEPHRLQRQLGTINRNAWRCAEILAALRTYAQPSAGRPKQAVDLNALILNTLLLIEPQLKKQSNIEVVTELAADLPRFHCDRGEISQALVNLLTNAHHAMPRGGKITIRTRHHGKAGRLVLQVGDTGVGMPAAIVARVFDPFFTTKPVGQGAGLGLSVTSGIVRAHGGEIAVDSTPGRGTTFTLSFSAPVAQSPQPAIHSFPSSARGRYDDSFIAAEVSDPIRSQPWHAF